VSQPAYEDDHVYYKQSRERTATSGRHAYRTNNHHCVTVAELIEKATAEGFPIRLAWSEKEINAIVPRDMTEWPTGVMGSLTGDTTSLPTPGGRTGRDE
jgi:hypothetical protein